jgi:hypothetical protein
MFKQSSKFSFQDIVIRRLLFFWLRGFSLWAARFPCSFVSYLARFGLCTLSISSTVLLNGHGSSIRTPSHARSSPYTQLGPGSLTLIYDPNALSSLSTIVSYHRLTRTACFRILRIGISPYLVPLASPSGGICTKCAQGHKKRNRLGATWFCFLVLPIATTVYASHDDC